MAQDIQEQSNKTEQPSEQNTEDVRSELDAVENRLASMAQVMGSASVPALQRPSLQEVVHSTIAEVLGVRIQPQDAQSFQRALMQRFERKEEAGRIVYEWKPGAPVFEGPFGAAELTGDQARLHQRAQACLKEIRTNLDQMVPLCSDADMQMVDTQKAIVLDLVNNIVTEFGREERPREVLVDKLFEALLGSGDQEDNAYKAQPGSAEKVIGVLGALEHTLCYDDPTQIEDFDDETKLTNGLMLRDNIEALQIAWKKYQGEEKHTLLLGPTLDLGSRLRALSRYLTLLGECVPEAQAALTSVGFGPAEQKTREFDFGLGEGKELTLDQVLSMIELFATMKAPKLLQEGKKQGVRATLPLALRLNELTQKIVTFTDPFKKYPFNQSAVKRAFERLAAALQEYVDNAQDLLNGNGPTAQSGALD
jgi:hypothetical protein